MSYAVQQYFLNGGQVAVVVRVKKRKRCQIDLKNLFTQSKPDENIGYHEIADPSLETDQRGLWAFEKGDPINLLCIPPFAPQVDVNQTTWRGALKFCKARRVFLIIDPPSTWKTVKDVSIGIEDMKVRDGNAAIYYPTLLMADPAKDNRSISLSPGGVVAGIIARTDLSRGVWKAPAGVDANLAEYLKSAISLDDVEIEELSKRGVNSLHELPNGKTVVWGARTLIGDEQHTSEWKYISVRRAALLIETSIYRGLQWVVFEPNDEPLWAQIRLTVGAFMNELFRSGALTGSKPDEAYFVKCDHETTTPNDMVQGVVNILVGFAPLKPTEFIVIKFQFLSDQGS